MKNITLITLGMLIIGTLIYKEFFEYKNHTECEIKELQKLKFTPTYSDRADIAIYCELKNPYEKKIFGPKITQWQGYILNIENDNNAYNVTKVKIYAYKGTCDNHTQEVKSFTYQLADGVSGASLEWKEEYKCYLPEKTEFWGKINKSAFTDPKT